MTVTYKCKKCNHEFAGDYETNSCPNCNIGRYHKECKCGHVWDSERELSYDKCPKCGASEIEQISNLETLGIVD